MTSNNNNLKSQSNNPISNNSPNLNPPTDASNPKDELLKSDMMKKLSLKEKWLNEQQSKSKAAAVSMDVDDKKKSFFTGILSSV